MRHEEPPLPDGHDWEETTPHWLKGDQRSWECRNCAQRITGTFEVDGTFVLDELDVESLDPCDDN